jgi:hypothetical protein
LKRSFIWPSLKRRCYWFLKRKQPVSGFPLDRSVSKGEYEDTIYLHNHMIENPSPLQQARIFAFLEKTGGKLAYLVFDSSFLSGAVFGGGVVSPGLTAPSGPGTEGCGDGAGGGGGGAGVSFFSQPANVTAKAKRVTADSDTIFFIVIHLLF